MKFIAVAWLALLLLLQLASASPSLLQTSSSIESPQAYGAAVLFTCPYSDLSGQAVAGSECSAVIDGQRSKAIRAGTAHTYGEILAVGQHSWYCSCSASGYDPQESSPRIHAVLPAGGSDETRGRLANAILDAEKWIAEATGGGENPASAGAAVPQAKDALLNGDYALANTLLANEKLVSESLDSRNRITDMGILLIPILFIGVLSVAVLFLLIRKQP